MNELKNQNSDLANKTTGNPMIAALSTPRAIQINEDQLKAHLVDLISRTEFDLGYKPSESKHLATLALRLFEEIKTKFQDIRVGEVSIAFEKGARGEYGQFFGLNPVTFHQWLKGQQFAESRKQALKDIRNQEPVVVKRPTKAEALKMFLEMWLKRYLEYKKSGVIYFDTPFRDYKILFENGLIFHDQSEVDMFIEQAKFEFVKDFEQKRKGYALTNKVIYLDKKSIVERIEKEDITVDEDPQISGLACELAIKEYFDKSTDFENKIKRLINGQ